MTIRELANAILDMPYGGLALLIWLAATIFLPAVVSVLIMAFRK